MPLVDLTPITDELRVTNKLLTDVLLQMQMILAELKLRPSCAMVSIEKERHPKP